jgi:hypothetical protein
MLPFISALVASIFMILTLSCDDSVEINPVSPVDHYDMSREKSHWRVKL